MIFANDESLTNGFGDDDDEEMEDSLDFGLAAAIEEIEGNNAKDLVEMEENILVPKLNKRKKKGKRNKIHGGTKDGLPLAYRKRERRSVTDGTQQVQSLYVSRNGSGTKGT